MRVPLQGFAPDVDPTTPGVLVDCDAIVPTTQGLAAANSLAATAQADLAATPTSSYTTVLLDGTKRLFACTNSAIYEASGGTWTTRSRVGGYTGTQKLRFCVFGNVVLSANRSQVIGSAAAGAGFVDIAGAPQASILVTAAGFVMALDTVDATYGDRPDGWWCSGLEDQTTWTPSAATQAENGRLFDTPGRIVAGAALGSNVVAYKATSMYMGTYVGAPLVWAWQRIPGDIGTSGAESVVTIGTRHFFVGPSDFYTFDGTVPQPMNAPVKEFFFDNLNQTYRSNIVGVVDLPRSLIYWHYPSINSPTGALDSVLIYNFQTNQWGKQALSVDVPVLYTSGAITYDGLGALYATYADLPALSYDSPFWLSDSTVPGVFVGAKLYALTGAPGASWLQTGDFGDMTGYSFLRRVTPRYRVTPDQSLAAAGDYAGTAVNFYRDTLGEVAGADQTAILTRSRFDFRRSARWHSVRINHSVAAVLDGLDVDLTQASPE